MRRETLRTCGKILTYIAESSPTDTTIARELLSKHVTESGQKLISNLRGRGCKSAHVEAVAGVKKRRRKQEPKHAQRKIIKRDTFPSFTSVTLQQSIISTNAEIASVSSEFDKFAHRLIQTFVLGTKEVAYKPIAPVDLNDLEILIPADNDTYIDSDIKLYVRGKLISASG